MGSPFSFCYVKGYPLAKDNCPGVTRCQRVPGRVDRRARQVQGYLTIKEAAERLGISERTVRRRIKEGSLSAELRLGQYGQQYFIKADVIETAQAITDVVEVKKVHDGQALSLAIVKALEGRDKALGGRTCCHTRGVGSHQEGSGAIKERIEPATRAASPAVVATVVWKIILDFCFLWCYSLGDGKTLAVRKLD